MKLLFILAFFITIFEIKCAKDECSTRPKVPVPTAKRLDDYLFCEYDNSIRPSLDQDNSTIIHIRFSPQFVEFDDEKNTLQLLTWVDASWIDQHLTWEPQKWDNIKSITVKNWKIWTPSLTVFNHGDLKERNDARDEDCMVSSNGTVRCVMGIKFKSHCPTDYDEWPFDKHNCTMHIGAWMFEMAEMLFKFDHNSVNMSAFKQNNQWHVHIAKSPRSTRWNMPNDQGEVLMMLGVILQRHGSRLAIIYILPMIILMTLTLVVLWLDSQSLERTFVACINFICHILGMSDLHWYFPTKGSITTPKILLFYEASVGLSAFALIFTCLLRKLRSLEVSPPTWIVTITGLVKSSPISPYLGINADRRRGAAMLDDSENNDDTKSVKNSTWQELATILESLSFSIVFLIYVIMLGMVLPPKEPSAGIVDYWA